MNNPNRRIPAVGGSLVHRWTTLVKLTAQSCHDHSNSQSSASAPGTSSELSLPASIDTTSWKLLILTLIFIHGGLSIRSIATAEDSHDFFELKVRPLLADKCWSCHGRDKQQGGLRLDNRHAVLKGSDTGPVIQVGDPEASRLIQVLQYNPDDIQMPPGGKLPPEEIEILRRWIQQGAPWPVTQVTDTATDQIGKAHWAFQPMEHAQLPAINHGDRCQTFIDYYLWQQLEQANMEMAPPADRATLIRRAMIDLWGLPPTYEQIREFVNDPRPDAYAQLIDRLLASPHYGERWGRHWLDLARYADTKGYVFTAEPRYPYAYTYRDYVIKSLNDDKPYDRFILEQLAADQLGYPDNAPELAALGFLTVGRRFLNRVEDIIDDRIDVVCRGLMALTVGCARCHDHKYDPVPTADYYSLYGVFASCQEPEELPTIGTPQEQTAYEQYLIELNNRESALHNYVETTMESIREEVLKDTAAYLLKVIESPAASDASPSSSLRESIVRRWKEYLSKNAQKNHPVLGLWHHLVHVSPAEFTAQVEKLKQDLQTGEFAINNPHIRTAFLDQPPSNISQLATLYAQLFQTCGQEWKSWKAANPQAEALPDAGWEEIRQTVFGPQAPLGFNAEEARRRIFNRAERNKVSELERQIEALQVTSPGSPPRAMVLKDLPKPVEPRIFLRGNINRQGPQVPRRFLAVLSPGERKPFQLGSGRLELAQAIIHPNNPLTARVMVNRVWQHHFGMGLVRSPGDFGTRGEPPTHPKLLDELALRWIEAGWSLKTLHRWIMLSEAYQQSSQHPRAHEFRLRDPENRLWWHKPRRRLELEPLRDSWLAVAGLLDDRLGGRPFESITNINTPRRTIYGLVNRNDLPGVYRVFDFADPDASAAERPNTTVPQQALFALNAPLVLELARQLGAQILARSGPYDAELIRTSYRMILARDPLTEELSAIESWLQTSEISQSAPIFRATLLAQTLLLTNEFAFVD